jgi:hypothetical protein
VLDGDGHTSSVIMESLDMPVGPDGPDISLENYPNP